MQYCKQYVSNVTTRVHLIVDDNVARRFSIIYPVNSEPPSLNGGSHCIVTLLLVTAVVVRFCGGDGGATNNNINTKLLSQFLSELNKIKKKKTRRIQLKTYLFYFQLQFLHPATMVDLNRLHFVHES